jgi:hypothetical protein
MTIHEQIKKELASCEKDISIGNKKFNQWKIIEIIYNYKNDAFIENNDPTAIFWNIASPRVPHFVKNIDLDTKDLMPVGQGETNFTQAWILKIKFKKWLRDSNFATLLDDLTDGIVTFGSMVWKKYDDDGKTEVDDCDLRNLHFDQSVKHIDDSEFVIEEHEMTETELREKKSWKNIDDAILRAEKINEKFKIYERWGNIEKEYKHSFTCGTDITLYEEKADKKDFPYKDFHLGKYYGRWLRLGIYERLFNLQQKMNTLINQNAQISEISSMLLLRSNDPGVEGNVLTQLENGQIIKSSDLAQVDLGNRNQSNFLNDYNIIQQQADKLCMTPEIVQSGGAPSGAAFRSIATLMNAALGAFKTIRDRIGDTLQKILVDDILPDVIKDWNSKELYEILEDNADIQLYEDSLIRMTKYQYLQDIGGTRLITDEDLAQVEAQVRQELQSKTKKLVIPKKFFNFDFGFTFNITGENQDKNQQNEVSINALTLVSKNPGIANIPLFLQYCENNGINPYRLTPKEIATLTPNNPQMPPQMPPGAPQAQPGQPQLASMVNTNA